MIKFEGTLEELMQFVQRLSPQAPSALLVPAHRSLVDLVKTVMSNPGPVQVIKAIRNLGENITLKEAKDIYEEAKGGAL